MHRRRRHLCIDAVGICVSDLHAFHGHDPRRKPGLVLGHGFAATVLHGAAAGWQVGMQRPGVFAEHMRICGS